MSVDTIKSVTTLSHSGYIGSMMWCKTDRIWHGRVLGIRDTVIYEGKTPEECRNSFEISVEDWVDIRAELGN